LRNQPTQLSSGTSDGALNAQAYAAIREALLSGRFESGTYLNIRPLAAQLGTSPMPVREALSRLRADGALEAIANKAFRVPVISFETFREVLTMRLRLEACACEHAAVKASVADVQAVTEAFDSMVEASKHSMEDYLTTHRRFHFAIYDIARMPVLSEVIEGLWLRMGPLLRASLISSNVKLDHSRHGAMVRAMRSADTTALVDALRDDLTSSLEPTYAYLAEKNT